MSLPPSRKLRAGCTLKYWRDNSGVRSVVSRRLCREAACISVRTDPQRALYRQHSEHDAATLSLSDPFGPVSPGARALYGELDAALNATH